MASETATCTRCRAVLFMEPRGLSCFACRAIEHFPSPRLTTIEAIEQFLKANRGE